MDGIGFNLGAKSTNNNLLISQWLLNEFSKEDSDYIVEKIGKWSFFKIYDESGLDKLEFLEFLQTSFQAKKDKHIQDIVFEKLKGIAPKIFNCDPSLYALSKRYRTWFILRDSFFQVIGEEFIRPDKQVNVKYFLWDTALDMHTPDRCEKLNNCVFNTDEEFKALANLHWAEVNEFCRCSLFALSERILNKRKLKAP